MVEPRGFDTRSSGHSSSSIGSSQNSIGQSARSFGLYWFIHHPICPFSDSHGILAALVLAVKASRKKAIATETLMSWRLQRASNIPFYTALYMRCGHIPSFRYRGQLVTIPNSDTSILAHVYGQKASAFTDLACKLAPHPSGRVTTDYNITCLH